jgi:3-methyladenine DNA glycosylase AlkD
MIDLIPLKNDEYALFQKRIIPDTSYPILGIYSKDLKLLAKENKDNYLYLEQSHTYLEEFLLHALILGYLKDFNKLIDNLSSFVYKVDNWALCDTLCASLKITKKYKKEMLDYIKIFNTSGYQKRFYLIMLKAYYVDEAYLDLIFSELDKINSNEYYVNMGAAWLLSECYIKYPDKTYEYMKNSKLNDFAFNKGISKIHDSFRVSDDFKLKDKLLRRN